MNNNCNNNNCNSIKEFFTNLSTQELQENKLLIEKDLNTSLSIICDNPGYYIHGLLDITRVIDMVAQYNKDTNETLTETGIRLGLCYLFSELLSREIFRRENS